MNCIIPDCPCEGPQRADWPMPDSPLCFFGPETWIDDDAIDRAVIGHRLKASEFTLDEAGELLGLEAESVRRLGMRGRMYPSRYEEMPHRGSPRAMYSAERLAGELLRRGVSV